MSIALVKLRLRRFSKSSFALGTRLKSAICFTVKRNLHVCLLIMHDGIIFASHDTSISRVFSVTSFRGFA